VGRWSKPWPPLGLPAGHAALKSACINLHKQRTSLIRGTAFCLLPFAFCLLPFAFCLLPFAFCLLPFAFCLLPFAFCLLPCVAIPCSPSSIPLTDIIATGAHPGGSCHSPPPPPGPSNPVAYYLSMAGRNVLAMGRRGGVLVGYQLGCTSKIPDEVTLVLMR
jgi:hypothetical protein